MMLQFLIPTVIYLPYFPIFCIGSSTMHNAVSVHCPYSLVVHISNEYCWILMSGSYVLPSDCIAAVESCITLSGIHGEWTGTETDFFSRCFQFSLSVHQSNIFHTHVSLHPLLCGSTDQAVHYHHLTVLSFVLHLLMTLDYSHTRY